MSVRSRPVDVTEGGTAGPLRQLAVGLREIAHSRAVGLLVALSVLASMVYGMDTVLFVAASEERLGLGPDGFGVLMTGLAVGGLLAAAAVNRLAAIAAPRGGPDARDDALLPAQHRARRDRRRRAWPSRRRSRAAPGR